MDDQSSDTRHHETPEQRFMRQVMERLDELVMIGQQSLVVQNGILKAVTPAPQKPTEVLGVLYDAKEK